MSIILPSVLVTLTDEQNLSARCDIVLVKRSEGWDSKVLLNELVEQHERIGSIDQAAEMVTIHIVRKIAEEQANPLTAEEGDHILLYGQMFDSTTQQYKEINRYVIMEIDRTLDGESTITTQLHCYDARIYAKNNTAYEMLPPMTASACVRYLAQKYGVPLDEEKMVETSFILDQRVAYQVDVYQLMLDAVLLTNQSGEDKYFLRYEEGKLSLQKRELPSLIFGLEEQQNLISITRKTSILEVRNVIKIISRASNIDPLTTGEEGEVLPELRGEARDEEAITKWGVFQAVFLRDEDYYGGRLDHDFQRLAQEKLRRNSYLRETVEIEAPAVHGLQWGDPVWVYEPITNALGIYWVVSYRITIKGDSGGFMHLVLSREDRYDLLEASIERKVRATKKTSDPLGKIAEGGSKITPTATAGSTGTGFGGSTQAGVPSDEQWKIKVYPFQPSQGHLTQSFGERKNVYKNWVSGHPGVDYGMAEGTGIKAAADGTVTFTGDTGDGFGNKIIIDHGNGWGTEYAHLSSILVSVNQAVKANEGIGASGATGWVDGPHLHFGVIRMADISNAAKNYGRVDPMRHW